MGENRTMPPNARDPGKTRRMRPVHWLLSALLLLAALPQEPGEKSPWTTRDFAFQESASGFDLSPDGSRLVWTKTTLDWDEQERRAHLQLTNLDSLETLSLTRGLQRAGNPKWSPNGKLIAFLTDRPDPDAKDVEPEGPQIWLIRPDGGEAWALTKGERGVQDFEWAGNDSIVFLAPESPTNYEQELKEKKDTSAPLDDEEHEPPIRLFGVDIESGETARFSRNTDWMESLSVSPNGRYAVTVHSKSLRYGYDQKIGPEVWLWDLEEEDATRILSEFRHGVGRIEWQSNSDGFYFAADVSSHPVYNMASESRLWHFPLNAKKADPIDLQTGRGLLFGVIQAHPKGVLALLENGAKTKLALYSKSGPTWQKTEVQGEHVANTWGIDLSADGKRLVYAHSTASKPEQSFVADFDGVKVTEAKAFTQLNGHLNARKFARTEIARWKGARDEDVEGILYYPLDYEPGKKYPLVLMIHGGPLGHDADTWNDGWGDPVHLYVQRGAFVLKPNYHGSSGYGLAFAESIAGGGYYTLPIEDIQKGVEQLIGRNLVDPEKLSTIGWSNGAILSTALTVKDTRYKAASVGAGGADWSSDWGVCAFGQAFSNYYLGRAPIEDPELYRKNAPIYEFDKIRTPTIFFHGTEDSAVPTFHSLSMYRTLQYLGKVPTKLVMFPGEPHGIGKPAHRLRKLEEELAWFDRHLFGRFEARNEALKEGSNLSELIELLKAKKSDGRFGETVNGVLVPETVSFQGILVGRFEVTRAQFAAFDPSYKFPAGTDDYPANGIPFEKATAYCRWLSQKAGKTYRLPNEDEAEKLYADGASGNTLDAWAGYAVNPADAAKLRETIKSLPPGALLKKAGRSAGIGKDRVYELGGNVAEWVTVEGNGVPAGGSADCPEDPSSILEPGPDYIGFRVVLEVKTK